MLDWLGGFVSSSELRSDQAVLLTLAKNESKFDWLGSLCQERERVRTGIYRHRFAVQNFGQRIAIEQNANLLRFISGDLGG
jgi:hypothetical protein